MQLSLEPGALKTGSINMGMLVRLLVLSMKQRHAWFKASGLTVFRTRNMQWIWPACKNSVLSWTGLVFQLTDIGTIERIDEFAGRTILTVDMIQPAALQLNIGQTILVDGANKLSVGGLNLWPDKTKIDILIDNGVTGICEGQMLSVA